MTKLLTLIIPCYNEEERLPALLEKLSVEPMPSSLEILFSDDGSTDSTVALIQEFLDKNSGSHFKLLIGESNQGKGRAVQRADAVATGRWRCFLDADLSTPLSVLRPALEQMQKSGVHLLLASRHSPGAHLVQAQKPFRWFVGRLFSLHSSLFHRSAFTDTQCGFKMWSTEFSKNVVQECEEKGWSFDLEWIIRAEKNRFEMVEFPVAWENDERSKVSALKDGLSMALKVPLMQWRFGSGWSYILPFIMLLLGLSMALHVSNDLMVYFHKAWLKIYSGDWQIYEPLRETQGGYYYSPLFALLGAPLAIFGATGVKLVYYLLYVSLGLFALVLTKRLIRYSKFEFSTSSWVSLGFLLLLMNNHFGQSTSGNINAPITVLMIVSYYLYFFSHKKSGAMLLALAINFKVYPLFVLGFYFFKKDFRFCAWTVFFLFLSIVLPILYFGWEENWRLHAEQLQSLVAYGPQNDFGRVTYQSLPAMFVRFSRLFAFDESLWMKIAQLIGFAALLFSFWRFRFTSIKVQTFQYFLSMLVLGLIMPASWVHHGGFVYGPMILLLLHDFFKSQPLSLSTKKRLILFLLFAICYSGTTEGVVGKEANNWMEYWNIPTWGLVALFFSALSYASERFKGSVA